MRVDVDADATGDA